MNDSLNRYRAYIECQFHDAPFHPSVTTPFVTISRQAGAGGLSVARALAERLECRDAKTTCEGSWAVFDKNLIERVVQDHPLSERLIESSKKTSETILRLAQMGHVILVGRGANLVTKSLEGGLHVRLIGSMKKRIEHLKEYFGFNSIEAADFITKEDAGRRRYVKKYFGADIDDPSLYDLTLNTDELGYEKTADIIAHSVSRSYGAVENVILR